MGAFFNFLASKEGLIGKETCFTVFYLKMGLKEERRKGQLEL